jgi:hypothetical protein
MRCRRRINFLALRFRRHPGLELEALVLMILGIFLLSIRAYAR